VTAWRAATREVWHEALTLPLVFLSVALGGGMRIGVDGRLGFVAPPLMALVLAVVLVGALYRSGALVPDRLVHPRRGGLENASGVVVVATLGLAAAQVISALTPEAGLLALAFNVAWLVLFGNTLAARPDRARLLTSLLVVFGAAFVVKYVLLGALYAPEAGLTKRVVMALVEGVSLGALAYQPPGPATGYVAFATVLAFLVGIAALPRGRDDGASTALVVTRDAHLE
jgi:membrane associated rhomboid family serine protease